MNTLNYKSIQGARDALGALLRVGAGQLQLHVPIAFLHRRLQQAADGVQQDGVESESDALPLRRVQGDDGLSVPIVAGLDAGEEERRFPQRSGAADRVV